MGSAPRHVSSSRQPREFFVAPETVPLAMRSPDRRLHPLLAWCVSSWAIVQYISVNETVLTCMAAMFSRRMRSVRSHTSRRTSIAPDVSLSEDCRYGNGLGSSAARRNAGARNGASASRVTTQGDTVVAKFFDRNGPSGWYSHA